MPALFFISTSITMTSNNIQPSGGSAADRSIPNANFTRSQLKAFIEAKAENATSYAVNRNPTVVYKFIRQNYGDAYPLLKSGAEATFPQMSSMNDFLIRAYYNLQPSQRVHFLTNLLISLPAEPELQNWTTPIN